MAIGGALMNPSAFGGGGFAGNAGLGGIDPSTFTSPLVSAQIFGAEAAQYPPGSVYSNLLGEHASVMGSVGQILNGVGQMGGIGGFGGGGQLTGALGQYQQQLMASQAQRQALGGLNPAGAGGQQNAGQMLMQVFTALITMLQQAGAGGQ